MNGSAVLRLLAWGAALGGGLAVLHAGPPSTSLAGADLAVAAEPLALLRLGGLALGWYLVAVTALGLAARVAGGPNTTRLRALADAVTVRGVGRLLDAATGASVAAVVAVTPLTGTSPAAAATTAPHAAATGDGHSPPPTIRRLPDDPFAAPDAGRPGSEQPGAPTVSPPPTTALPGLPGPVGMPDDPGTVLDELGSTAPEPAADDRDPTEDRASDADQDVFDNRGAHGDNAPADQPGGAAPDGRAPAPNPSAPPGARRDDASGKGLPRARAPQPSTALTDAQGDARTTPPTSAAAPGDDHGGPPSSPSSASPGLSSRPAPGPGPGPAPVATTRTHEVRPGDHLWSIAEGVLRDAWQRPPSDHEVAPYWRLLVEANRDRLVRRDDPDLILPGQVFVVPEPPTQPAPTGTAQARPP